MASTITLDSNTYSVFGDDFSPEQTKAGTTERATDGTVVRQEANVFASRYQITLRCSTTDLSNLRTSFAKATPATNALNFVDIEGFNWNPSAGSNDSTHAYSTGVYFVRMGKPRVMTGVAWDTKNRYRVEIELSVNAKGLRS